MPYLIYKGHALIPDMLRLSSGVSEAASARNFKDGSEDAKNPGRCICGLWAHVTATLDFETGEYAMYVNGTLLYGDVDPGAMEPLLPGGELEMGATVQTISSQPTQFTALAESSFSADVLRLYNRTLSPAEVAAGLWAYQPLPATAGSLLLHWRFDTPGVEVEEDYSGNGNHGRWGASPNLHQPHVYYQSKPEGVVEAWVHRPASVMSTAPTVGASRVSALAVPGAVVELILAESAVAAGACTLLSLPTAGLLAGIGDQRDVSAFQARAPPPGTCYAIYIGDMFNAYTTPCSPS